LGQTLRRVSAAGSTALHDAVCGAVEFASQPQAEDKVTGEKRLYGIVLLSDGRNTAGTRTREGMYGCLPSGEDVEGVKVFAVAYGSNADKDLLQEIAMRTNGKAFTGDPVTIEEVYLAISFEQ
jgi:Ca-activated chloride channel family protein